MLTELAWGGCVLRMVLQVRQNMLQDTAHHCGEGPWLHTLKQRVADNFCFCLSQGGHLQQRLPVREFMEILALTHIGDYIVPALNTMRAWLRPV